MKKLKSLDNRIYEMVLIFSLTILSYFLSATLFNPEHIINTLALELVIFISAQFILMRSYKFIVQMTEVKVITRS
ncbi:MAG: hypothetical protein PF638_02100 [Candidatus Delongbacteria bacterium]|jgi:hypothetical protein|nr:hypothetical protein [Candidatus Delongbacteria bacterium]